MSALPPSDENCPICNYLGISYKDEIALLRTAECPRCGRYYISGHLIESVKKTRPNFILSGLARNMCESESTLLSITPGNFESLETFLTKPPIPFPNENDIPAKADFILKHIRRQSMFPGNTISVEPISDFSLGFCKNSDEFKYLLSYLLSLNYIINVPLSGQSAAISYKYQITPAGWAYLSGIGAEAKEQGFIAMAFCLPTSDVLHKDGLNVGIENAGYKPLRIDRKEHNNRIDDEIVAEIRKSRFVVADLTDKNAGAYFEAGFAQGLGKPVIWTCQQSEIDAGNVHFDTRQYSIVSWEPDNLADFAKRLTQRIEATIGRGRYCPEPISKQGAAIS